MVLPQLPDWEPVGVGDGVVLGVVEGVADGVAEGVVVGLEPHVPEESGVCRTVSVSSPALSVMRTVMPPREGFPQEGEVAVAPAQLFSGDAQPLPSMLVERVSMSDWHTIWTGCPSAT